MVELPHIMASSIKSVLPTPVIITIAIIGAVLTEFLVAFIVALQGLSDGTTTSQYNQINFLQLTVPPVLGLAAAYRIGRWLSKGSKEVAVKCLVGGLVVSGAWMVLIVTSPK